MRGTRKTTPPGSAGGEFGPDDQRGRMHLVTPVKVMQEIEEVRIGRTFCLSLPLGVPSGRSMHPRESRRALMPSFAMAKAPASKAFAGRTRSKPDLTGGVNDDVVSTETTH